jgi:signal transduction histidine kinase
MDLVYPEDLSAILGSFQRILAGQPEPVESRFIIKSGEIRWGRTFARLIVQDDTPVGMQGVISDITERKLAEVEMLRAREAAEEMERVKSDFLASVSHELRTPLNVIIGYTAMLLDGAFGTLTSAQRDPLQRIDKHAQWLFDLVTQVLTLGQIEERRLVAHPVMLQLPDFFREIAVETRDLQARADLEFVWHVAPDLPAVYTDPGKLKVVIMNLVNNAIKFTSQGRISVEGQPCNGGIEISVTDTGIGIAAEAQTVIFEAFRQGDTLPELQTSGVGLGLHLAKRLVEFLGGTISVQSEVERGATFRVWLPLGKS